MASAAFGRSLTQFKNGFFDAAKIMDTADRGTERALLRQGAFVRRASMSEIRRRKKSSRPGQGPTNWTNSGEFASLKNILFAEDGRLQVIVGPVGFGRDPGHVPELMEFGGVSSVKEWLLSGGKWTTRRPKRDANPNRESRGRIAHYRPRPFMKPGLRKGMASFVKKFKDCMTTRAAA